MTDKLTVEEIETFAKQTGYRQAADLANQLVDCIRENERLRSLCAYHELRNKDCMNEKEKR